MRDLDGCVALVTGGARGIGAAIATQLSCEGADIFIADLDPGPDGDRIIRAIRDTGQRGEIVRADVSRVETCKLIPKQAVEALGRLDIVVNNAGGALHDYTEFGKVSEEQFERMISVNLRAPFFVSQAAVSYLEASGRGRIVNVASELAFLGDPVVIAYAAAKSGVVGLTRSLALALAPQITVNAVAPGPTATAHFLAGRGYSEAEVQRIPMQRLGEPEDIAHVVAFLAGPRARHVTGQTWRVDGGLVMP